MLVRGPARSMRALSRDLWHRPARSYSTMQFLRSEKREAVEGLLNKHVPGICLHLSASTFLYVGVLEGKREFFPSGDEKTIQH